MDEWVFIVLGALIGGLASAATAWGLHYYRRANIGLGEAQLAVEAMRKEVIDLQDQRIRLLQGDVERLTRQNTLLSDENERLRARVQRLEDRVSGEEVST